MPRSPLPITRRLILEQRRLRLRHLSTNHEDSKQQKIAATQQWFESVVIGEKLCPFAPPLLQNPNLLRIVSSRASNTKEAIFDVATEVKGLVGYDKEDAAPPVHETTLVVFDDNDSPNFLADFRDFVRLSWELQEEAVGDQYVSDLQLVLFHPKATHQTYGDSEDDNPGDYTIRSPYPTVHLLREVDVLQAVQGAYPNLETLPARNKEKMVHQGLEKCRDRLQACRANMSGSNGEE
jgi:hypothetical protein